MSNEGELTELLRGAHAEVLHPGDVLVLRTERTLSARESAMIRERLLQALPDNKSVIVDTQWTMTIEPRGAS